MGDEEEETTEENARKSILKHWIDLINKKLSATLKQITPIPACYGHMYTMVRWINLSEFDREDIEENASRIVECYMCPHEEKCFKRSLISYVYQLKS